MNRICRRGLQLARKPIAPPSVASSATQSADKTALKQPNIRYVGWLWDLLPGRRVTLQQHSKALHMDAMNPASFYRDYEEFKRFPDKLPINNASSISSKQIPSIKGKTLKGEKRDLVEMIKDCKLTIVMFKFRDIGEKHLADYREYLINNYKREFRVQFVDVVVTENYMFRPLTALINWGNKKRTPQEYHSKTLVHYGSVTRQRLDLGMRNSLFGWVFLCDRNGRVLWETNGKANQQDFNQLDEIIKSRLNSLQNSNNNNK